MIELAGILSVPKHVWFPARDSNDRNWPVSYLKNRCKYTAIERSFCSAGIRNEEEKERSGSPLGIAGVKWTQEKAIEFTKKVSEENSHDRVFGRFS